MSEYRTRILEIINEADLPLDTEKVRDMAGISNWATCSRLLFELALEGKIEALKTSKSWVFSKKDNGQKI